MTPIIGDNMTKLDAVNELLRAIGARPVTNLQSALPAAQEAEATIDRKSVETQQRDWWFNIDYNVRLSPQTNGRMEVAENVTRLEAYSPRYVVRKHSGTKCIYDNWEQTFQFDATDELCIKIQRVELDFEDLPEVVQSYVLYGAAAAFVRAELDDTEKARDFDVDGARTYENLLRENMNQLQMNALHAPSAMRLRGGVHPYRRGRDIINRFGF